MSVVSTATVKMCHVGRIAIQGYPYGSTGGLAAAPEAASGVARDGCAA